MPDYQYEAIDRSGDTRSGRIDAADEAQAYERLRGLDLTIVALGSVADMTRKVPWYQRDLRLLDRGLGASEEADIAEQIAVLIRSRMPVSEALRVIAMTAERRRSRDLFKRLWALSRDGLPLNEAFDLIGGQASPVFRSMLIFSAQAADPASLLQNFARFLRGGLRIRSQIASALIYPAILVAGAVGVLLMVALFLAPSVAPLFEALGRPMPASIAAFLRIGTWLQAYGHVAALGIIALAAACLLFWRHPRFVGLRYRLTTRLPGIGRIVLWGELARMLRAVDLLLRSGQDLPAAFRQSAAAFAHGETARVFVEAADALEQGRPASDVLGQAKILPGQFRELFHAGEQANMLREVLPTVAENLEVAVERKADAGIKLLAPAITLVLGGAIGLLVYAIISAVLSVNDIVL